MYLRLVLILEFSFDFVMWFLGTCFDLRFYFGWCLLVGVMSLIILVLIAPVEVVLYWFAFCYDWFVLYCGFCCFLCVPFRSV